jgi:solute carrier family 25 folate transporter 32
MDANRSVPAWKHVVAGCMSGIATSLVTTPLDVVKTRLQNQVVFREDPILPSLTIQPPPNGASASNQKPPQYRGTVPSLWRVYRAEGIGGLYKGLGPAMMGYLPAFGIYFSVYSQTKVLLAYMLGGDASQTSVQVLAAMTAGAASASATNPLWVVRTRMMLREEGGRSRPPLNTLQYLARIWQREGVRGLYRGLSPSLLGTLHVAVQLPTYEKLKLWQHRRRKSDALDTVDIMQCSIASKIVATITTYPHEVLRTRIQNQRVHSEAKITYSGIVDTIGRIWREEGWRSFYRGLPTTIMRVVPASAVTFVTYEFVLSQL